MISPRHRPTLRTLENNKAPIIGLLSLLGITAATGLFAQHGNQRTVDLTPYLQFVPSVDKNSGGHSRVQLQKLSEGMEVQWELDTGFAFPYAGVQLRFDSCGCANFAQYHRLLLDIEVPDHREELYRLFLRARRPIGSSDSLSFAEALISPVDDTLFRLGWSDFQVPSWWIAQKRLPQEERKVHLEDVREMHLQTPEGLPAGSRGRFQIHAVRLEGWWVAPRTLSIFVQTAWIVWGVMGLLHYLFSWKKRVRIARHHLKEAQNLARHQSEQIASLSHEIRTPLHGIMATASLLELSPLPEEQRQHVALLTEAGHHLSGILDQVLDWSKIEAGCLVLEQIPVSVRPLLESTVALLHHRAQEKGIALQLAIADDVPLVVLGDPLRLRQILLNLLSNALKFTPTGSVTLTVTSLSQTQRLRFSVQDTGLGIAPEAQTQLFRPYAQLETSTARRFGGTGLGLAISQSLVHAMGSRIEVTSELGVGTTFWFDLPHLLVPPALTPVSSTQAPSQRWTGKVLVIDDNRINRVVAAGLLRHWGCEVTLAASAEEGLALVPAGGYSLILLDCHLPGMDGYQACQQLRSWRSSPDSALQSASHTPVAALTADVRPETRDACREAGMDDFLAKPFQSQALANLLQRWLPTNEA